MSEARWPATTLRDDSDKPIMGSVCAAMWPTYSLAERERCFDELYVWTEGFQASTMQRARIQLNALRKGFALLAQQRVATVGVTLSFGTVERCLDLLTETFEANRLLGHRIVVLLRGQIERMRSPYRVRGFTDWLREQRIPIGYRLAAPRIGTEARAVDFLQPDFARLDAPASTRLDIWRECIVEARLAGLDPQWLIATGLETDAQLTLACDAGFGLGQGSAVKPAYQPPSTRAVAAAEPAVTSESPANSS